MQKSPEQIDDNIVVVDSGSAIMTKNPRWAPHFIYGRIPPISVRHFSLLSFVALALMFENYDISLLASTLKYIAIDLQIDETQLGTFSAWIRLGGLPVLLIVPFADLVGRRRLFLFSVVAISVATFITAFSVNVTMFVITQVVSRTFLLTAAALAVVIVTEEFPAEYRGWGLGALGAMAAFGHGLGALLFAAIDILPYGWRALYAFGILPLFLLPMLADRIQETQRFTEQDRGRSSAVDVFANWLVPLKRIAVDAPLRFAQILTLGFALSFGQGVVFAFVGYYVLMYLEWSPGGYSAMVIFCGFIGIIGNVAAGRLADRLGRKPVGIAFLMVFPLTVFLFFRGPELLVAPAWIMMVFSTLGAQVIIRALSSELFPTAYRGSATGALTMSEALGAGLGLLMLSLFSVEQGDILVYIPWLSCGVLVAAFVMVFFPETAGLELEEI
jgi:MFS family permease